jgi:transposase
MNTRKSYSKEFKLEAVRLAEVSGNLSRTARELDIAVSMLRRWKKQLEENEEQAFPGKGNPRDEELAQLRRKLRRLEEENAILKKAVGIFTSGPR